MIIFELSEWLLGRRAKFCCAPICFFLSCLLYFSFTFSSSPFGRLASLFFLPLLLLLARSRRPFLTLKGLSRSQNFSRLEPESVVWWQPVVGVALSRVDVGIAFFPYPKHRSRVLSACQSHNTTLSCRCLFSGFMSLLLVITGRCCCCYECIYVCL